jgi:hypothetical protein
MAWSSDTLSSEMQTSAAAGLPCFIPKNHLAVDLEWHDTATNPHTTSDWTDPDWPTSNLYNGVPYIGSRAQDRSVLTYYLYGYLNPTSVTIDSVYIQVLYAETELDIAAFISNNADMAASQQLFSTSWVPGNSRAMLINLLPGWNQYTGTFYIRFRFTNAGGDDKPPIIGEIVLGERKQLSRKFSTGWDDAPDESAVAEWESRGRAIYRYTQAEGFRDYKGRYPLGEANNPYGFSDDVTIREVFSDCTYGRNPIVFLRDSATFDDDGFPREAYFGHLKPEHKIPRRGVFSKDWKFDFMEAAPFYTGQTEG